MDKLLLLIVTMTMLISCKQSADQEKSNTDSTTSEPVVQLSPDSLKKRITMVKDSMDMTWKKMILSDDQKIADIKRLLQEVTYTKVYDPGKVESLMTLADSVKSIRYTQDSMTSGQIDKYDFATEKLIKRTFQLVENNPEMAGHSITEPLKNDIMKAESELVNYRILYDRWAKEYNRLVEGNRENLQQLGEPYSSFQKKPIFELPS